MSVIGHPEELDTRALATRIKKWLDGKNFETKALEGAGSFVIKARKASALRAVVGADRALEIEIRNFEGQTQVDVRQGSWKTNFISNAVWVVATGGMNLAFTGWSLVIQKELETFIKESFSDLGGLREVEL